MSSLLELYLTFVKIGSVTFGGGYAMLPVLERELVNKRGWTTTEELLDYFAVGQCTPGLIGLNVSTFIGQERRGTLGGVLATLGFLTVPILIILVIAAFLTNYAQLEIVQHAFAGIRVCVCVLILQAVLRLWKKSVVDAFTLVLYLLVFGLNAFSGFLPVRIPAAVLVLLAGAAGIAVSLRKNCRISGSGKGDAA